MAEILWSFALATAILAVSPGPDNIYVLLQSIVHGKMAGLATVLGLISGCIVHTCLIAFGVSAIIRANSNVYFTIKLLGALYLFYLAFKVFKSSSAISLNTKTIQKKNNWQLFKQGIIMNVLNPKVSVFFLAFFPGFLFSSTISTITQFFVLGWVFMAVSFIVFSCIAVLAGTIAVYIKQGKYLGFVLKWLQIVVFVGIAIFILISKK